MFFKLENLRKFNEKIALIHYKDVEIVEKYSYQDLVLAAHSVIFEIEKNVKEKSVIGIFHQEIQKTVSIPLILGILNSSCAFCFLSLENELLIQEVQFVFTVNQPNGDFEKVSEIAVFKETFKLFKNLKYKKIKSDIPDLAYVITTSGTTGKEKIVRVPSRCILPNILGLQKIFQLENDVVFSSAPRTFDVFVVDFFLALISGSCLLILDQHLRFSSKTLEILFPREKKHHSGVTFMQITPSVFQRWSLKEIQERILEEDSSLRFLVLGGENCPSNIRDWQNWKSTKRKRIFNIYGITEVSSWATIKEITEDDLLYDKISVGAVIDQETLLDYREFEYGEEMFIGSKSRICVIDEEDPSILDSDIPIFRATGDIVERFNNNIKIIGRTNDIIKVFGHRTNLKKIESCLLQNSSILECSCIFYKDEKIIMFYKTLKAIPELSIKALLREHLKPHEVPDDLVILEEIPLTNHGKISKQKLIEIYEKIPERDFRLPVDVLKEELRILIESQHNIQEKCMETSKRLKLSKFWDHSFKSLGGTSVDALKIVMNLESLFHKEFPDLFVILLDDSKEIFEAFNYLKLYSRDSESRHIQNSTKKSLKLKIVHSYDLKKCIDAPISYSHRHNLISVGSHSHLLVNLSANFDEISLLELGDRIESPVTFFRDSKALVGCYDGFLYCFDIFTGEIDWKFDSGGMIKSKILVLEENLAIFGNYCDTFNLCCLEILEAPVVKWSLKIEKKGILGGPLFLDNSKIFVSTLDGTCAFVEISSGRILWSRNFGDPIFGNSCLIPNTKKIIFPTVSSSVYCLNFDGEEIWEFQTNGNIFSSFEFLEVSKDNVLIFFGCHDRNVYCLSHNIQKQSVSLVWKAEMDSQIYATPKIILINRSFSFLVVSTTKGKINLVDLNGNNCGVLELPGEIFSTPFLVENRIFVGCRDNFVYCLEVFEDS